MALINAGTDGNHWLNISASTRDPTSLLILIGKEEYYQRGFTQKYNIGYTQVIANSMCLFLLSIVRRTVTITTEMKEVRFPFEL